MSQTQLDTRKIITRTPEASYHPELPHEKLPVELWSEIFVYCLEGAYVKPLGRADQGDGGERQLPWVLGRVCLGWRRIVLNEPRLWNRVQVPHTPLTLEGSVADYYLNMARSLFSLSKGMLISFSTTHYLKTHHGSVDLANPLPELLVPHAKQFRKLSIQSPCLWIYSILELPSGSFQSLEVLTLRLRGPSIIKAIKNPHLYEAFRDCARLRRVHFVGDGPSVHMVPSLILMPWDQLRHVTFDKVSMPFEEGILLLERCKNIMECSLCFDYMPRSTFAVSALVLPHLQSLCLAFDVQMDRFLAPLTLPSLRKLKFKSSKRWLRWSKGTIEQLVQRSGCRIELLHSTIMIRADDIAPLLKACPAIVDLSIPSSFISNLVIKAMINADLVRSLEVVDFAVDSMDLFLDLVEARSPCPGRALGFRGICKATGHFSGTGSDIDSLPWDRYEDVRRRLLKDHRTISFKMS
ncbi:hypothetical protein BDZ94DRAFT_1326687 [Collybia nuda]|uniref:F-box domain-containing protein n=1 Tax=Collybia nuda TaxID=64659 RepID=A0A9P6CD96_9AGAR|nr:hypothetical protein BDZ94DRAFT_1326687 [Collybia nuda]